MLFAICGMKYRFGRNAHFVSPSLVGFGLLMKASLLIGDALDKSEILVKGSAKRDIHDLQTSANAERRHVQYKSSPCKLKLEIVPLFIDAKNRWVPERFSVCIGRNIAAARKKNPVKRSEHVFNIRRGIGEGRQHNGRAAGRRNGERIFVIRLAHIRCGIDFCSYSNKRLHGRSVLSGLNARACCCGAAKWLPHSRAKKSPLLKARSMPVGMRGHGTRFATPLV